MLLPEGFQLENDAVAQEPLVPEGFVIESAPQPASSGMAPNTDGWLTRAVKQVPAVVAGIARSGYDMGKEIVTHPVDAAIDVGRGMQGVIRRAPDTFRQIRAGVVQAMNEAPSYDPAATDAEGYNPTAGFYNREGVSIADSNIATASKAADVALTAKKNIEADKLADPRSTKTGTVLESTAESLLQQAPGAALAIGGLPQVGLPLMGLQTFGQKYAENRAEGMSIEDATNNAGFQGGAEIVTEMLPFMTMAKFMKPGKFSTKAVNYMLSEVPGEHIATALQNSSDVYFAEKNPEQRMQQVKEYLGSHKFTDDQVDTFWTTLLQGGITLGAGRGAKWAGDKLSGNADAAETTFAQPVQPVTAQVLPDSNVQYDNEQNKPDPTPTSFQNEGYDDYADMDMPEPGPLQKAAAQTAPVTAADTINPVVSPDTTLGTPAGPVTSEPMPPVQQADGMAPPSRKLDESDKVDYGNAELWAENRLRNGDASLQPQPGEETSDYAFRLLDSYRAAITPTVSRDSVGVANQTIEPAEQVNPAISALTANDTSSFLSSLGFPKIRNAYHLPNAQGDGQSVDGRYTSPPLYPQEANKLIESAKQAGLQVMAEPAMITMVGNNGPETTPDRYGRLTVRIGAITNGNTDNGNILPSVQTEGASAVERANVGMPNVQGTLEGSGGNNGESTGIADVVTPRIVLDEDIQQVKAQIKKLRDQATALKGKKKVFQNGQTSIVSATENQILKSDQLYQDANNLEDQWLAALYPEKFTPEELKQAAAQGMPIKMGSEVIPDGQEKGRRQGLLENNVTGNQIAGAPVSPAITGTVVKTIKPSKPNTRRQLDPTSDSMIVAVAKMGGVDRAQIDSAVGNGKELAGTLNKMASREAKAGLLYVIHTKGRPLDEMVVALKEQSYLPEDAGINDMLDALADASRGVRRFSDQNSGTAAEDQYNAEAARYREMIEAMTDAEYEEFSRNQWLESQAELLVQAGDAVDEYIAEFDGEEMTAADWQAVQNDFMEVLYGESQADVGGKDQRINGAATGKSAGSVPEVGGDNGAVKAQTGTGREEVKQDKLFPTPPTFGKKPQPKTTKGDVSTSGLVDSFTSVESVQPELARNQEVSNEPDIQEAVQRKQEVGQDLPESRSVPLVPEKPAVPEAERVGGGEEQGINTIFTEDAYRKARAVMKAKLNNLNAGIDPELMNAGFTVAGYHIEKGARRFADFAKAMVEDLGDAIRPYLKSFYNGVRDLPGMEKIAADMDDYQTVSVVDVNSFKTSDNKGIINQEENTDAKRGSSDLEPDSGSGDTEDGLGEKDVQAGSGTTESGVGKRSGRDGKAPDSIRRGDVLPRSETAATGEYGDKPLYSEDGPAGIEIGTAGDLLGQRSGDTGVSGAGFEPVATAAVVKAVARVATLSEKAAAQKTAQTVKVVTADRDNIDKTLPFLLPGQRDDVKFTEERFAKPTGYGVLFTNGTGTGKTYTGLGIIKRLERQGKKNILVVTPNAKIINDWVKSGKNLLLDVTPLKDTKDGGQGINITTYANFSMNEALAKRQWDAIVFDEAHTLNSNKDGNASNAQNMMQAVTLHPDGAYKRARLLNPALWEKADKISESLKDKGITDSRKQALETQQREVYKQMTAAQDKTREEVKKAQGTDKRPRVVFLSATPFAYDKNIQYANGYLFDWNEGQTNDSGRGYNSGDNYQRFMMTHFGYIMKYNRLQEPGPEVDRGIMQRQFNSWLKSQAVLSGRALDSDYDYDRKFILIDSAIGRQIDEGLEWLRNQSGLRPVEELIRKRFDYLSRRYLLESIKAKESILSIKEHLELGRKVVVFHDYNQGGGFSPFDLAKHKDDSSVVSWNNGTEQASTPLGRLVRQFMSARPDLVNLPLKNLNSPIVTLGNAFPDLLLFNGTLSSKERIANVDLFQDDESGRNIILVQSDAGGAGISLHDTTGKHARVLINLGLPVKPTMAIQQEGRIYRVGQASNAMFRYFNTGTNWERYAFATSIARKTSGAENLAAGDSARMLLDAFVQGFEESDSYPAGHEGEGTGGKERDRAANAALTEFDKAMTHYWATQKKTSRNKAAEGVDYFATPEPLGYKMSEWADVGNGESALEPSGGHAAIARYFNPLAKRRMIEPSMELASRAALIFDGDIVQGRFEDHNTVNKYDAIIMNPPFGSAGRTAVDHLEKAAQHLKERGRIVALLPDGPSANKKLEKFLYEGREVVVEPLYTDNRLGPIYRGDTIHLSGFGVIIPDQVKVVGNIDNNGAARFVRAKGEEKHQAINLVSATKIEPTGPRKKSIASDLHMVADIKLPTSTFSRAGTSVATHIVILDKGRENTSVQIQWDYSGSEDIKEFFERIRNAEIPARERDVKAAEVTVDAGTQGIEAPAGKVETASGQQFALAQFAHTQTKEPQFVATPEVQVEREQYSAMLAAAKRNGGYWSKYNGNGAVKGFLFKTEQTRQAFIDEMQGGAKFALSNQTETPEFKKWFGNSKVVDDQNKPLVVYHGSPDARFIESEAIFKNRWTGEIKGAHWFTPSKETALTYADDRRAWDYQNSEPGVIPAFLSLQNPLVVNANGSHWREAQNRGKTSDVIKEAQNGGHDGVIIKNVKDDYNNNNRTRPTDTYVVFDSTQIKSATDNNGDFNPENPDIRFNLSSPPPAGIKAAKVQAWVKTLPIAKRVKVWQSPDDLKASDPKAYNQIEMARVNPSRVQAMEFKGNIHLITGNIPNMKRAKALTIGHELAHAGQTEKLVDFSVDWFKRTKDGKTEQARTAHQILEDVAYRYGYDLDNPAHFRKAVQEATAAIAEQVADGTLKPVGLMQRLFMYIKYWLRKNGLIQHVSDSELSLAVAEMLRIGEKRLSVGKGGDGAQLAVIDQTETPEFKKWFGDSKVVDDQGKPLVVYHGTNDNFSAFGRERDLNLFRNLNMNDGHFYFTDSPETAATYANDEGQNIMPVYLAMQNPLVIDATGKTWIGVINKALIKADEQGNDGVIVRNVVDDLEGDLEPSTVYVALKQKQIKSAIGNNGNFDPESSNVNFALAPEIKTNMGKTSEADALEKLKDLLPQDVYLRLKDKLPDSPEDVRDTVASIVAHDLVMNFGQDHLQSPLWVAEDHPDFKLVYETAKERDENLMAYAIRMSGGLLDKQGKATPFHKIKNIVFDFDSTHETAWARLVKEANLGSEGRAMHDALVFEADAMGAEYSSYAFAMRNPRIKAAGVTQHVFDFYQKAMEMQEAARKTHISIIVELMHKAGAPLEKIAATLARNHIENELSEDSLETVSEEGLKNELYALMEQMKEDGKSIDVIARTISDYRGLVRKRKGRVHRDHGEGNRTVDVFHHITALNFESSVVNHETKESKARRKKNPDLAIETAPVDRLILPGWNYPGNDVVREMKQIVKEAGGVFKKTGNDTIIILVGKGNGKAVKELLNDIKLVNESGEALHKVLKHRRFVSSKGAARKHQRAVEKDLAAAMPVNYKHGERYSTETGYKNGISEEMFSDSVKDMATSEILSKAINSGQARGEFTKEEADEMRKAMIQDLAETFMSRGAGSYQIRRMNHLIEGYDRTDAIGKFEGYISATSGMLSKAEYSFDQHQNLQKIGAEMKDYTYKYIKNTLRNTDMKDKVSGNVRATASLMYLGFSFSWMLVNSTQPYVLGQAELSRHTDSPTLKIAKAEKDIVKHMLAGEKSNILTDEEKKIFEEMSVRSQEHSSMMHEMTGGGEGGTGVASKWLNKSVRTSMAFGQKIETLNRRTMILAAYRVFRNEKGMDRYTALKEAMHVNSLVNIDQGRYNLPTWARGPFGRMLYSLQSYIQHMLNYLHARSTSGNRDEQKAVLRLLFAMFLLGGLPAGAPGSDELDKLILKIFGYSPKMAMKGWVRKFARDYGTVGEMLEGFVWHGLPGTLKPFGIGVSLSGATQLRAPIASSVIGGDDMFRAIGGPVAGLAIKADQSVGAASRGDWYRAIEYIAPNFLANPMSAWRQWTDGVKTASGKRVDYKGKQLKMEGQEAALRAIGLQPARTADISESRGYEIRLKAEWLERRNEALANFRNTRNMKDIFAYNKAYRNNPQVHGLEGVGIIDSDARRNALQNKTNRKKAAWQIRNGVD